MPFTPIEQAHLALRYLLETEDPRNKAYWNLRDKECLALPAHPFGLETDLKHEDGFQASNQTFLVADPGSTNASVQAMTFLLRHHLADYHPENETKFRLRVIYVRQHYISDKVAHMVYFEIITGAGTFLCGGCTDFSGAGGYGHERLIAIFQLAATFCGMEVEQVVIPPTSFQCVNLCKVYTEGMREKQGLAEV
ncbi:MAG: hypothetical protein KA066_00345 [Candidatus Pacebacteria bacterium]|nr:hypothetical protein [Candidatus Paceibacterota bacterium]